MADNGAASGASNGALTLHSPLTIWIRIGFATLTLGAAPAFWSLLRGEAPSGLEWGALALAAVISPTLISAGFSGVTVTADQRGLAWRQPFVRRKFLWANIEGFGVATVRVQDPTENPVARAMMGGRRMYAMIEPMLGVNLKLGDRNPATVAYQRGFMGYDHAIPVVADRGLQDLADELERRRQAALADVSIKLDS